MRNAGSPFPALTIALLLQGCLTSNQPLLSQDQNITETTLPGTYVAAKSQLKIKTASVRLVGKEYKVTIYGKQKLSLNVDLQNFQPPFYIAQVTPTSPLKNLPTPYAYWLVYIEPSFLVLKDIPCTPDIIKEAGLKSNDDVTACELTSHDDLMAVAGIAAKRFLDDPSSLTSWIKE